MGAGAVITAPVLCLVTFIHFSNGIGYLANEELDPAFNITIGVRNTITINLHLFVSTYPLARCDGLS